jgi:tetratricopeptide (TPR) repeat protein
MRFNLAGVLRLAERFVDAMVGSYNRLFRLDEQDAAEIYMHLGTNYARSGKSEDALTALQRTLSIRPENALAWFQLGMVHLHQEALEEAVSSFEQARQLGFDAFELHYFLAEALSDLERYEEAVAELYLALDQEPESLKSAEPAYRLGLALDQLERYEEAVAAFKIAIARDPKVVSYYQSLGFTLETMGQRDEAIKYFKLAVNLERRASR